MKMKAKVLSEKLIEIAKNYNTLYVMGCFGAPLTGANVSRYCTNHVYNRDKTRTAMIKAAANKKPPVYGFDCVCLIKGILWGWEGNANKTYGGAMYQSNGVPDISADTMISKCTDTSNSRWDKLRIGEALWLKGHIGIYVGNGLAVECSPRWENKVQITAVANIGNKKGYNSRTWTKHGKLPYVDYADSVDNTDSVNNTSKKKNIDEIAKEVIKGLWGNGQDRRDRLSKSGYNYSEVQKRVNDLLTNTSSKKSIDEIAREVIRGNWGNGQNRKDRLTKAGYDYSAVQKRVNELL